MCRRWVGCEKGMGSVRRLSGRERVAARVAIVDMVM